MTSQMVNLNDAMPGRRLLVRWVVRGRLTLETAMHLGGGGTGVERVDAAVLRDGREGRPLLPGTTLAGALRDALADRLGGYRQPEHKDVGVLFGGARTTLNARQSLLIVFDALGTLPASDAAGGEGVDNGFFGVEVRDGVAISPETGTAEDHKKYDYEVWPPGTSFDLRVDLLIPKKEPRSDYEPPTESSLLEHLGAALATFTDGENGLGARCSRGLGRFKAVWAARRFELGSAEGWLDWVLSEHEAPVELDPGQGDICRVLNEAAPGALGSLRLPEDKRKRVEITLDLKVAEDLLVRSPSAVLGDPDVSHLRSGGKPVIPGTSLGGVMRAQALRIARLVRVHKGDADRWVCRLFGTRFQGKQPLSSYELRASRIMVGEARLKGSEDRQQTRIALDRFTQGVVDGALFEEQPVVGGRAKVRLELRDHADGELGLVLLVIKDLLDGTLPVGGSTSVGRGVLGGTATVRFRGRDGNRQGCEATLEPGKEPSGEAADQIDKAIREFHTVALGDVDTADERLAGGERANERTKG